jgi:multisubunit Na+/H+ antiporter MnhG subunit
MNKNPWIAVLINIIFPGLGYIFVGERMWFGILFVVAGVADIIWRITEEIGFSLTPALLVSWAAIWVATSIDVYFLARAKDEQNSSRSADHE